MSRHLKKSVRGYSREEFSTELYKEESTVPQPREAKSQKTQARSQPLDSPNRNDKKTPMKDKIT